MRHNYYNGRFRNLSGDVVRFAGGHSVTRHRQLTMMSHTVRDYYLEVDLNADWSARPLFEFRPFRTEFLTAGDVFTAYSQTYYVIVEQS